MNVEYDQPVSFLGRNGQFIAAGINGMRIIDDKSGQPTVRPQPITSTRTLGRCHIDIPIKNVKEMITQLQQLIK